MTANVSVYTLADRTGTTYAGRKPYVVKWSVNSHQRSRAYSVKSHADGFRSKLITAFENREEFDPTTGLPVSTAPEQAASAAPTFLEHARAHVRAKWATWAPKSRRNAVQSLVGSCLALTTEPVPAELCKAARSWLLHVWLRPDHDPTNYGPDRHQREAGEWLLAHSLPLTDVKVAEAEAALRAAGTAADGRTLVNESQRRVRNNLGATMRRAERDELIARNPVRLVDHSNLVPSRQVDPAATADLTQAMAMIELVATKAHRAGPLYRPFLLTILLSGMRPSEVSMLHTHHLTLPDEGWGTAQVWGSTTAPGGMWTDNGEAFWDGSQKRREVSAPARRVPLPPALVFAIDGHIKTHHLQDVDRLFTTSRANPLTSENRALKRAWAAARAELHPAIMDGHKVAPAWRQTDPLYAMTPYSLRHTAASVMIAAGVGVAETARRLGHTPAVLMSVYAGFFKEDEQRGNAALDTYLADHLPWLQGLEFQAERKEAGSSHQEMRASVGAANGNAGG